MNIRESWKISTGDGKFSVSDAHMQAAQIEIEAIDEREGGTTRATVRISADEWREIVAAVEWRLIQREDPHRVAS